MRVPRAASAGFIVLAALLATVDERTFGLIPDGQEMLSAAAAIALHGEIGVSRRFGNAVPRPGGTDAFSRYGMGQSLLEVPVVLAARGLRTLAPEASTAPLFALLPIGLLSLAAAALSRAALALGLTPRLALPCGVGLVLASPLWGYAASDFSEPLQVAALSVALASILGLRSGDGAGTRGLEVTAGIALGMALLAKSSLLPAIAPLAALASFRRETTETGKGKRRMATTRLAPRAWFLGALVATAGLWAFFELYRFGRLLGGYAGEDFPYPPVVGLLRLTLFPNKGLLVYAPVLALAPVGLVGLFRFDRRLAAGLVASTLAIVLPISAWWAWDGQAAWGPRLVLPALPLLFLCVAGALRDRPTLAPLSVVLVALGLAVNAIGALQPFPGVYAIANHVPPAPIPEGRAAGTPYEIERRGDGTLVATAPHHLSLTPSWSPIRIHLRILLERFRGGDVLARLSAGALGDLVPPFVPVPVAAPSAALLSGTSAFRWPFWGRAWLSPQAGGLDPFEAAQADQARRR